jgi:hypothetical protein
MSVPQNFDKLTGRWRGTNRLHLAWIPEKPSVESDSKALIDYTARGRFLKIEYDWAYDGQTQEGLILLGNEEDSSLIKAFWIDSWHMGDKFMVSEGSPAENGAISLKGFYSVPDHPDWGWRTVFSSEDENSFRIVMYNVTPEGEEDLAVEAFYERV